MSGPRPTDPLFPDWTRDATAASLRERREVLEGRLGRLAESLRESTSPRFAELHTLRSGLQDLPEGRAWLDRAQVLTVAQQQRQAHVASTRRGQRMALALAAGVLLLSLVGWASKRPRPLQQGIRTPLHGQRIHTAGESVAVAGRGVVTLAVGGPPSLRLHKGRVEISSRGSERVTLAVGPQTVQLDGGRVEAARVEGSVQVRAAEGRVVVVDSNGVAQVLEPGGPPWEGRPPEEAETCAAAADPGQARDVLVDLPDGLPEIGTHLVQVRSGGTAPGGSLGGGSAERPDAASHLASGVEGPSPSAPLSRPPPTLSLDADYRPWSPPNLVRTSGGAGVLGAGPTAAEALGADPVGVGSGSPRADLVSSVGGSVVLPTLSVAHDVVHALDGNAIPMAIDPESGLGFCPLPLPTPDLVPVPASPASGPAVGRVQSPARAAAGAPLAGGPGAPAAAPTREIPAVPRPSAAEPGVANAPVVEPQAAREALLGLVFGPSIEGPECAP